MSWLKKMKDLLPYLRLSLRPFLRTLFNLWQMYRFKVFLGIRHLLEQDVLCKYFMSVNIRNTSVSFRHLFQVSFRGLSLLLFVLLNQSLTKLTIENIPMWNLSKTPWPARVQITQQWSSWSLYKYVYTWTFI
jgi:hypothetical protein